ncbi:MAG TPA: hypothetical protein PKD53_18450, partial [Chloroflexaceae bacterium]|nr:hypothetical protein [Chloroflexaceae bacterium]
MFPFSSRRRAPLARGVALALLIAALVPALVMAQEQPARIDIRPVPASASGYFELALEPGSTHELTVEIGNYGAEPAEAHTYAAGVYSLINGGMGVDLAGEAITGATTWLSYAPETFILAGQQAVHRTFTVTVPADAPPGEYLTSIVVEGNPTLASGSGGAVINQVVRKAIAVSISIAGPRRSALEIGAATHHVVASKSVVRIELLNRGNVRVGPEGRFALRDS